MAKAKRAKVITVAAVKGGTAKTATAGALAMAAAANGKMALAIDLDPQASLSIWLRAQMDTAGSCDLLTGRCSAHSAAQSVDKWLDVMAGSANLAAIKTTPGSGQRLKDAITPLLPEYDLIVIDTAPAMGELQNNALQASTGLIIPVETDSGGLQGMYQITDIARHVQQTNAQLEILGAIITKYDPRANINRYMRDVITARAQDAGYSLLLAIRSGIAIREAMAMRENLFSYAPKSKPAQDYMKLYNLIMQ